jgi:transposase
MQVYLGIDWSESKHDAVFHNEKGAQVYYLTVAHNLEGFHQLDRARQRLGVSAAECVVGMETVHSLLIDFLWEQGYEQIYILPPNQVKSSRGRRRQSGAKDDRQDADLIAEIVRTDRPRLHPWQPGSPLLQQMRASLGTIRFLTQENVRLSNRLRSVLLRYYPAALHVFSSLDTQINLKFIQAYPTPQAAARLSLADFQHFARQQHYSLKRTVACYARLQQPYAPTPMTTSQAYQAEAILLAELLLKVVQAKAEQLRGLEKLFQQHPDRAIFDSLPAAGALLAPGLLVKFGEDRQRFPRPELVQALAGTSPVTIQSGKSKWVNFRRACDKEFRYLVDTWARQTVNVSLWATSYYQQVRPSCQSEHDAYRRLGNRWLEIVWRMWQDHTLYDEDYKLRQQALRRLPKN